MTYNNAIGTYNNAIGTCNNDVLEGTIESDYILGLHGNDTIEAGKGNDIVCAGSGDDLISGGEGHDCLAGGSGNDTIDGGADNDIVFGGKGRDIINGGAGRDILLGGLGHDIINGGAGDDVIASGEGNDFVVGDFYTPKATTFGENLVINGSFENNEVEAGEWDVFTSIEGWTTTTGSGIEIQELSDRFGDAADGTAWVELDSHNSDSNSGMIQHIDTEVGKNYQVSFQYSPRPDVSADSNTIEVYWNGELIDTIDREGGATNSWQTFTYNVAAGDGDTTGLEFRASGHQECLGGFIDDVAVRQVYYSNLDGTLASEAVTGNDVIYGGNGNDAIVGGAGFDTIFGGRGNDVINGTDSVNAGLDSEDRLNGGAGADVFVLGDATRGFYNSQGWIDCVVIEDFNAREDIVRLHGSSNEYQVTNENGNAYLWETTEKGLEGVAVFENTHLNNSDLNSGAFEFV